MDSNLATYQPSSAIVPFRLPALRSLTGPACLEQAAARPAPMVRIRTTWPSAGLMPVSTTVIAPQHQGGAIADGGCDVTDPKFSTLLGPPSCSPPV